MTDRGAKRPFTKEEVERGDLPPPLDPQSAAAKAVIDFMGEYYRVWNAKDARALATQIYRVSPERPMGTETGIQRTLDKASAEGWAYSTLDAVDIHSWGDGWLARGFYSRFTADGEPTAHARRLTAYVVRAFADGLRITDLPLVY